VPLSEAHAFGVMDLDAGRRIARFIEKSPNPPSMPDKPDRALASMGIYIFNASYLYEILQRDAGNASSSRDFGKDIIPFLVTNGKAVAHRFTASCVRSEYETESYWRDVGTVDAYWEANIDLTETLPALDLYDTDWPIWTYSEVTPPAKFVHDLEGRRGSAVASLVSGGCIVSGAAIKRTMLSPNVRVNSFSSLEEAVVLPSVHIHRNVQLKKVVIDTSVVIPEGLVVGEDPELDAKRFRRTASGICLITQPMIDRLAL
jgi:glucose-1-phosphate adenylyltransferase